jgi:predicted dinucleotide-binding enzyme
MKLAIIGAGNVGGALGKAWVEKAGHEVFFGVRQPDSEKTRSLLAGIRGKAEAGRPEQAAAFAEVIVLTTPWAETEGAIRAMGSLKGKIVLDCTNPLGMVDGTLGLTIGHSISGGEKVQGWAAGASVFKTLNTTGFTNMTDANYKGGKPVMFVAGDDAASKPKVTALVGELGFDVVDVGPLRNARLLEAHAMLWIDLALNRGLGRDWAFAIVRR